MSHTKVEWKVGNKSTTPPIIITVVTEITGEGGEKFKLDICDVMPKVDKSREANAKLIAAAPDMLKALISAEMFHQGFHSPIGTIIRKAIEKATK